MPMLPHEYSRCPWKSYCSILLVLRSKVQTVLPDPIYSRCRLDGSALIRHSERYLPFSSNTWMRWLLRSFTYTRRVFGSTATPCTLFMYPGRFSFGGLPLMPQSMRNLPFLSNLATRVPV